MSMTEVTQSELDRPNSHRKIETNTLHRNRAIKNNREELRNENGKLLLQDK
jgi:hypothetical protein